MQATAELVTITRVFDAPREMVFAAWSEAAQLARWHAPNGCTIEFRKFDFRPGGAFISYLRTPSNHECLCKGAYLEIVAPERIVYSIAFCDGDGNFVEPAAKGMDPGWPRETVVTVTLEEREGKTTLTLHQSVAAALAKKTGAYPSWLEMLDRLAGALYSRD